MFNFFKKSPPKSDFKPSLASVSATPSSTQQHGNSRRELIRVVLKDTLRLHGIPLGWLACEVIVIRRASNAEEVHIQLVITKWNEQLLRYAPALQQQLLLGLDRFDPSVDHSSYVVSWRFSSDCGCPFPMMPPPTFWTKSAVAAPAPAEEPVSVLDRRHSRRPPKPTGSTAATSPPAPADDGAGDFSPTQISPLH